MSLINCPECGKEISEKAKNCPHCGYKTPYNKSIIIKVLAAIGGVIAVLVVFSGVFDFSKAINMQTQNACGADKQSNNSQLLDKYYMGNSDLHVYIVRFNSENTVEIVDAGLGRKTDSLKKAYGTYEVENDAFYIYLDNDVELTGRIRENGDSIVLDNEDFDTVAPDKLSSRTLDYFD